jgi:hypothetical protein
VTREQVAFPSLAKTVDREQKMINGVALANPIIL